MASSGSDIRISSQFVVAYSYGQCYDCEDCYYNETEG